MPLAGHQQVAEAIVAQLEEKPKHKVLALFRQYLEHGYYPYYLEYQDRPSFT